MNNNRFLRFWPSLLTILLLALPMVHSAVGADSSAVSSNYEISAGDLVEVRVFQEDDLLTSVRVSREGTITMPLIGKVGVASKTPQQAAESIRVALAARFLVNPQVTVNVMEYTKRRFVVLGQVQKPGAYDMPDREGVTLLQAIGMAGGYTRIADPAKVTVKRTIDGREQVARLNAKEMAREASGGFEVKPGDVITVGETFF